MVGGGHNLVLSLGLGDGNAHTRGLKQGCPKKDGKNNNKNKNMPHLYSHIFIFATDRSIMPALLQLKSITNMQCVNT